MHVRAVRRLQIPYSKMAAALRFYYQPRLHARYSPCCLADCRFLLR